MNLWCAYMYENIDFACEEEGGESVCLWWTWVCVCVFQCSCQRAASSACGSTCWPRGRASAGLKGQRRSPESSCRCSSASWCSAPARLCGAADTLRWAAKRVEERRMESKDHNLASPTKRGGPPHRHRLPLCLWRVTAIIYNNFIHTWGYRVLHSTVQGRTNPKIIWALLSIQTYRLE